jgi:isochorismate synthase
VLAAIDAGVVRKAVVSAAHAIKLPAAPDPVDVVAWLRARRPGTSVYLFEPSLGRAFVGASPERLVRVQGLRVETVALAGSTRRGVDEPADRALGEALLSSPKDREEQAVVVDQIVAALAPITSDLTVPDVPRLRRLRGIQHLETPIVGALRERRHVLEVAARLHPTPALGGAPRLEALALIERLEGTSRGLYGGVVGWTDAAGDGDLTVAIRGLLIAGRRATAFAGAGIVAGSRRELEIREIELKLTSALSVLDGVRGYHQAS